MRNGALIRRIPPEILPDFSEVTLERGIDYFLRRRVEKVDSKGEFVRVLVRGSALYEVQIERFSDGGFSYYCTCPHFEATTEGCKHVVAALIAADLADPLDDEPWFEPTAAPVSASSSPWRRLLSSVQGAAKAPETFHWPAGRTVFYRLGREGLAQSQHLRVQVFVREPKKDGHRESVLRLRRQDIEQLPDSSDRRLLSLLSGSKSVDSYSSWNWTPVPLSFDLTPALAREVAPILADTGRCARFDPPSGPPSPPLRWNPEAWHFRLSGRVDGKRGGLRVGARLFRGERGVPLGEVDLIVPTLVIEGDELAELADSQTYAWLEYFQRQSQKEIVVAPQEVDAFLLALAAAPNLPPLDLPPEYALVEQTGVPLPQLRIDSQSDPRYSLPPSCQVRARYGPESVSHGDPRAAVLVSEEGRRLLLRRDFDAEAAHLARLLELGFKSPPQYRSSREHVEITERRIAGAIRDLLSEGWEIELDGSRYRPLAVPALRITSGIDWFEISSDDTVDPTAVPFPLLLKALEQGSGSVRLADGSIAVIDSEWLERNRFWLDAGKPSGTALRFSAAQAALVEAWLADESAVDYDAAFGQLTTRLATAAVAVDPPAGFVGHLREYQREGLAWLQHLAAAGLGGCLADDMGLGKTVQLLAFLAGRPRSAGHLPSLVVAPKTLVGNWCAEAARFVPDLVVRAHTGSTRQKSADAFAEADLVVTSYDLLRRDLALFGGLRWDTCVLDESQAIKNRETATAKAARQVSAAFRVAATGTPVENHLGELWSLFEFLNPGLLGKGLVSAKGRDLPADTRDRLARGLRPFLLRRTKAQVAPDLPAKTEQTVWCDLEPAQRRLYDELRDHYRAQLTHRIARQGMKRSAIQVLEALLRLRQAACHPQLLDRRRIVEAPSAKFDWLLPRLAELREEGHKALVFSQFTTLLGLLRTELDQAGAVYEYLDGQSENRQALVERFQTDPDCPLFLISLKAGGYGLNLTAAEYVFLLDPWWNPAVEAQAIDRTHRIGQSRPVFAYRLISRGTVEERILELQAQKRDLADAIFAADASPLAGLTREDLDLLLG